MANTTSMVLGPYFQEFIRECTANGEYGNATEVVRAGLRLLREHRLEASRRALLDSLPTSTEPLESWEREVVEHQLKSSASGEPREAGIPIGEAFAMCDLDDANTARVEAEKALRYATLKLAELEERHTGRERTSPLLSEVPRHKATTRAFRAAGKKKSKSSKTRDQPKALV